MNNEQSMMDDSKTSKKIHTLHFPMRRHLKIFHITGGKHPEETEAGVKNIFKSQNNFMNDSDFIWTMMKLILVDWRKLF